MLILAIETSCDETSAAVVEDGRLVLSNVVLSQIDLHAVFGGVVPEIASRQHVRSIDPVVLAAVSESGVSLKDIDAVAVTYGPGLAGALLVGVNFARSLARGLGVQFLPVNHLEGHIHSVWLSGSLPLPPPPPLPLLALIVSGGHTELVLMRDHGVYEVLGRTLDDAAGEAFDKVARILGLPYPGGPWIQRAAQEAGEQTPLPRALLPGTRDFSFSGLKTATLHAARRAVGEEGGTFGHNSRRSRDDLAARLAPSQIASIAAGFQESVVDVLVRKTRDAAQQVDAAAVAIVGGVAANTVLAERARSEIDRPVFVAERRFSTDNAAMIGSAAFFAPRPDVGVDVVPNLEIVEAT